MNTVSVKEQGTGTCYIRHNFTSEDTRVRKENLHGTEWLVSPVVALKEMVLDYRNNRHELIPFEEIENSVFLWEGMPVMVGHPTNQLDRPLSGRSLEAKERAQIGMLQNVSAEAGKLKGEMWIDLSLSNHIDGAKEIIDTINDGELIDVSTAYQAEVRKQNGIHNNDKFNGIQRNIRPDHLAVLPDQKGNCSIEDGCGAPRLNHKCESKRNLLSIAREPEFSGTVEGNVPDDWPPDLEDFIRENGWDAEQWDDLSEMQRQDIVNTTLLGEVADTFSESMMFPVVDAQGNLRENALVAILGGRGAAADVDQQQLQSSRGAARNLLDEHFDRDLSENDDMEDIDNEEVKGFYETIRNFFTSNSQDTDMAEEDEVIQGDQSSEEDEAPEQEEEETKENSCQCQNQKDDGSDKLNQIVNRLNELEEENEKLKEKINKKEREKKETLVEALNSEKRCPLNRDELEDMNLTTLNKLGKEYCSLNADFTAQAGSDGMTNSRNVPQPPKIVKVENSDDESK